MRFQRRYNLHAKSDTAKASVSVKEKSCFAKTRSGMALVLVLAFLVLITALVLAFFSSVTTESNSAKSYAEGATSKQLADSAVQLVIGAIKIATSGTNPVNGTPAAWASQPGMIRSYDNNGNPLNCYKLYSSDTMVVSGTPSTVGFSGDVSGAWSSQPALFTDLNSPVISGTTVVFPIVDGNAMSSLTVSGSQVLTYSTSGTQDIAGFYVDPTKVNYSGSSSLSPANTPVPMPVKWVYVLRNGAITVPTGVDSTGKVANWSGSGTVPTSSNPIVGRIAFWTDDESCKVNINTASEGTYWDAPRENSQNSPTDEIALAENAPMQHEYQRYPGHPATTSLSAIFSNLANPNPEALYGIIPRIGPGGSMSGTIRTTMDASVPPPVLNTDRLYTSVDEFLFSPSRAQNDATNITKDTLRKGRFFITAHSRSPDVNLFGKPRVCIWPMSVADDIAHRTAYDRLIAFCSTVKYPFYFQRQDATDPNIDLPATGAISGLGRNRMLLEYLRNLTSQPIPGFGGKFSDKYGASNQAGTGTDRDQILTEIFDYIRSTNLSDTGVTNPYTTGINSNHNGIGQVIPIDDTTTNTHGFGRFRTVQGGSFLFIANADDITNPAPPALPAPVDPVSGTVPPVASGSVRVQAGFIPSLFDPSIGSVFDLPNFRMVVTGLDQFTLGGTSMGFSHSITFDEADYAMDSTYCGDQFGLRQFFDKNGTANTQFIGQSIDLPKGTAVFSGGTVTVELQTPSSATNPYTSVQTVQLVFPSGTFPLPLVFSVANDLTVPVTDAPVAPATTGTTSAYVQSYVSSGSLPPANSSTYYNMRYFSHHKVTGGKTYDGRINSGQYNSNTWILNEDVVRAVSVSHGDVRLVAAQKTPPASGSAYPFAVVGPYASTTGTSQGTHNLWDGVGHAYNGARAGHLAPSVNYDGQGAGNYNITVNSYKYHNAGGPVSFSNASDIPFNGVTVGKTTAYANGDLPGDWDNGIATMRDGPYINKADEGDKGLAPNHHPYSWKGGTQDFALSTTLFTPNRLIPSAVMFGSLPTGVFANRPWQTLLFRPDPTGIHPGNKDRKGDGTVSVGMPADHLLLDLFSMPVVEPYAISEPLSTAGRINMNYQIVPFTYINRNSGVRAVLKSEKVIAIADSQAVNYKLTFLTAPPQTTIRYPVNIDETLKGFAQRFAGNGIFVSPSEICTIPIVPSVGGATYALTSGTTVAGNFWTKSGYRLTGDNSRERIYSTIYPRLTTKSNTYIVHMRVQTLKKVNGTSASTWDESKDIVTSEYRGSQIVERYVDANDSTIPDYADTTVTTPIDSFYKFRVVNSKKFTP